MTGDRKSKTTGEKTLRLLRFGEAIEHARKARGQTQERLAQAVSDAIGLADTKAVSQSYIARIEKGLIADPRPELLRGLATAFSVPYEEIIGLFISDKYKLPFPKISILLRGPLSLDEIAFWEKHADHNELWVVATKYLDRTRERFRDAILEIIRRGGSVTFFIPKTSEDDFKAYRKSILSIAGRNNEDQNLVHVALGREQVAVMAASYVIANPKEALDADPTRQFPTGYLILNDENGEPSTGIRMYRKEIFDRVVLLHDLRNEYSPNRDAAQEASHVVN